jgi:hypothetical protein
MIAVDRIHDALTKRRMDRVPSWPDEDVAELDEFAREIEARRRAFSP